MTRDIKIATDVFPLAKAFTISRGSRTEAHVLTVTITHDGKSGWGECVPYARYGESVDSVTAQIESILPELSSNLDTDGLQSALPPGAARNAVDCALWDLKAKQDGVSVAHLWDISPLHGVETAYTLSLDSAERMGQAAHAASHHPILKIKLGGVGDKDRIRAVHSAAPNCKIIVDANEAWTPDTLVENMLVCADAGISLIEQPLPADNDHALADIPHPVPICADESAHTSETVSELKTRYDFINVKLDKTGGLTEAMKLVRQCRDDGFGVMIGCMVGSSLAMAPALLPAQLATFVDLDGPLLLGKDRTHALHYANSVIAPPRSELWG